jgi:hypothetical protein
MKQLPDGTWRRADGTILTSEELAALHKTAPLAEGATAQERKDRLDLQEGQSSGVIQLND